MTDRRRRSIGPGLGARPASATSGYDKGSILPTHVGEPIVRIGALEKYFGTNHVLRGVDLEVRQREAVMVIGRSGSGKTTLLRCINFLEEPTAGWVEVDGLRLEADPLHARSRKHQEQIRQIRLRAGMLFQDFNLFPHMTVLGQLRRGADAGAQAAEGQGACSAPSTTSRSSASSTSATSTRPACRAARSSASPSPVRCAWSPRCSSSTSRLRRSTPS